VAVEHEHLALGRAPAQFVEQPRLADAGLPGQLHERPLGQGVEHPPQPLELVLATDQSSGCRRTRHRPSARAYIEPAAAE
jgi:hypothetical protein